MVIWIMLHHLSVSVGKGNTGDNISRSVTVRSPERVSQLQAKQDIVRRASGPQWITDTLACCWLGPGIESEIHDGSICAMPFLVQSSSVLCARGYMAWMQLKMSNHYRNITPLGSNCTRAICSLRIEQQNVVLFPGAQPASASTEQFSAV